MERSSRGATKVLSSLHTHSRYCDGRGEIEQYARAAIAAGLSAFGASGHAPLPFPCEYAMPLASLDAYRADVRATALRHADDISVFLGLELDYLPGLSDFYASEFLSRGFDYFVASVHYVGEPDAEPWAYDESEAAFGAEVARRHGGDARPVVEDYYRRIILMVDEVSGWGVPVVVGHLDRIALWNAGDRYFPTDDDWYADLVDAALSAIQRAGMAVELNTSGWAKPIGRPNPDLTIARRCAIRDIPMIITADAHDPTHVNFRFSEAVRMLAEAGIRELLVPAQGGWRQYPLEPVTPTGPVEES